MKPASLDLQDYVMFGMIGLYFTLLYVLPEGTLKDIVGGGGIVVIFVVMVGAEFLAMVMASSYDCINMRVRPENRIIRVFHNGHKTFPLEKHGLPNWYITVFPTKTPIRDSEYGLVNRIGICHTYPPDKRFVYGKGITYFKQIRINHGHCANITAYKRPAASADIRFLDVTPIYDLAEAPGDYYLMREVGPSIHIQERTGEQALKLQVDTLGKVTAEELKDNYETLAFENSQLRNQLSEVWRQSIEAHEERVRLAEQQDLITSETSGLMNTKLDVRRLVIQELLVWVEACGGAKQALETLQGPRIPLKIDKRLVLTTILAAAVTGLVYLKYDSIMEGLTKFQVWFSLSLQNQLVCLAFLVIVLVAGIVAWRNNKK